MNDRNALSAADLAAVTVIIPAQNEEASIGRVLADLPHVGEVIVVDNDSSDGTGRAAADAGATVVLERRRGYGQACLAGMDAVERNVDAGKPVPRIIVFVDGDYSDYPEKLTELVAPIFNGQHDFVIGSRSLGKRERGSMTLPQVFGNWLACSLMRMLWGVSYTDLGPFRAINYSALKSLGMVDQNFGWTVEMQIKAAQAGLRTTEVPVPYRCRVGVSKISGTVSGTFKAGYKILYTIFKYRVTDLPTIVSVEQAGQQPQASDS